MFDRSPITRARPGRALLARSLSGLVDAAARISRVRPGSGLLGIDTPGGLQSLILRPKAFHAKLAGSVNPYSFVEVHGVATAALWATTPHGRTLGSAYALNGTTGLGGEVVLLHPVASGGEWYWFPWSTKPTGGGSGGGVPIPGCFCSPVPATLTMTSADESCNFDMFQNCTIVYGPTPPALLPTAVGDYSFLSTEGFPDPVAGGAIFYYFLTCEYNQWSLSRVYIDSPYGSPYRDGVLYTWLIGDSNTCVPFSLNSGTAFPGSDLSCCVAIFDATIAPPDCTS